MRPSLNEPGQLFRSLKEDCVWQHNFGSLAFDSTASDTRKAAAKVGFVVSSPCNVIFQLPEKLITSASEAVYYSTFNR
jgi:hypothetical protein